MKVTHEPGDSKFCCCINFYAHTTPPSARLSLSTAGPRRRRSAPGEGGALPWCPVAPCPGWCRASVLPDHGVAGLARPNMPVAAKPRPATLRSEATDAGRGWGWVWRVGWAGGGGGCRDSVGHVRLTDFGHSKDEHSKGPSFSMVPTHTPAIPRNPRRRRQARPRAGRAYQTRGRGRRTGQGALQGPAARRGWKSEGLAGP